MKSCFATARIAILLAVGLDVLPAAAQLPHLKSSKADVIGGARVGGCNALRLTVSSESTTPVTKDFAVAYMVILEGLTAMPATMYGGIGGNTAKSLTINGVPYWGPGAPYSAVADYGAGAQAGVVEESNENNNSLSFNPPLAAYCSKLSVADTTAREGDRLTFTVTLAPASYGVVSVDYALINGTVTNQEPVRQK